jgi:hypothetical protein
VSSQRCEVFAPLPKHIPGAVVWAVTVETRPTYEQGYREWYQSVAALSKYSAPVSHMLDTCESIAELRAALVEAGETNSCTLIVAHCTLIVVPSWRAACDTTGSCTVIGSLSTNQIYLTLLHLTTTR